MTTLGQTRGDVPARAPFPVILSRTTAAPPGLTPSASSACTVSSSPARRGFSRMAPDHPPTRSSWSISETAGSSVSPAVPTKTPNCVAAAGAESDDTALQLPVGASYSPGFAGGAASSSSAGSSESVFFALVFCAFSRSSVRRNTTPDQACE